MAELEAFTRIDPPPSASSNVTIVRGQYTWRYTLPENKIIRLGSDPVASEWSVPEDRMISRFHATLEWNGSVLIVTRRGEMPPEFPSKPQNQIWYQNKPVERCEVKPSEWFTIGQTRFTVRDSEEQEELEGISHVRATVSLASMIRAVESEQGLFRQVLKVMMEAVQRVDAAAIVRIPSDTAAGELRLIVVESHVRPNSISGEFNPSRKLVHRAINEKRRSCLHYWPNPAAQHVIVDDASRVNLPIAGVTPWAVCTPFQDGSKRALYFTGHVPGEWDKLGKASQEKLLNDLTQYQHLAELLVGMIETTLRTNRLAKQVNILRRAWPQNLWKYLEDPDELERMLTPKENAITTLFCDLRNYSLFASQNAGQLLPALREVGSALDVMASAITDQGGVVSGFRGDAVVGFWGWPDFQNDQIAKATRVAIAIQRRLNAWTRAGRCGLGVTHGVAVAGRLGTHDLSVIDLYGPVVNLTFRLEAMTKAFGVPIIVSQKVADHIAIADPQGQEMRTRPLGKVRVKGFPEPHWACELYSMRNPSIQDWQIEEWLAVIQLFTAGNWKEAQEILLSVFPSDPAAQCLMRVMDKSNRQPPDDWDGSFAPSTSDGAC